MARKDMRLFARIDLDYADHPKISRLSDSAFRAHVEMILYARKYKTDGIIPERFAKRVATESLSELLANDPDSPSLIDLGDGTYELHGYADMNETREEIERRSRANSENGRRGGVAKARTAKRVASNSLSEKGGENVAETETETDKRTTAPAVLVSESDFERAWAYWPKKVERKKSFEKFKVAARRRGVEQLTADIRRFGEAYARTTDKQFVPALNVWIGNERWTDELPSAPGAPQSAAPQDIRDGIVYVNGKPRVGGPNGMTVAQFEKWRENRER